MNAPEFTNSVLLITNASRSEFSFLFTQKFLEISEDDGTPKEKEREIASIVMSDQLAKKILLMLQNALSEKPGAENG